MPVDFIVIRNISTSSTEFKENGDFDFVSELHHFTGEIDTLQSCRSKGLTVKTQNGNTSLRGSLHKYYNGGKQNFNDFNLSHLAEVISDLETRLKFDSRKQVINGFEFGVNICVSFPVSDFLDSLISYKGRQFEVRIDNGWKFYQCQFKQYTVKIYDKGAQHQLLENVLRFEIRVEKMIYLTKNRILIKTLSDLLTSEYLFGLGNLLLKTFSEIMIDDPAVELGNFSQSDRDLILEGRRWQYWDVHKLIKSSGKSYSAAAKQLQRQEERLRLIFNSAKRKEVESKILQKWKTLTCQL